MPAPPKGGAPTDRSRSPAKSVNAAADAAARSLASRTGPTRAPVGNTPGRPGKAVMQGGLGMTAFGQNNAMSGRNVSRNSSLPALTGGRSKDQSRLPSPANKDQSRLPAAPKDQARLQQGSGFLKPPNWPKDQARLMAGPTQPQPYAGFAAGKIQDRIPGLRAPGPSYAIPAQPYPERTPAPTGLSLMAGGRVSPPQQRPRPQTGAGVSASPTGFAGRFSADLNALREARGGGGGNGVGLRRRRLGDPAAMEYLR